MLVPVVGPAHVKFEPAERLERPIEQVLLAAAAEMLRTADDTFELRLDARASAYGRDLRVEVTLEDDVPVGAIFRRSMRRTAEGELIWRGGGPTIQIVGVTIS